MKKTIYILICLIAVIALLCSCEKKESIDSNNTTTASLTEKADEPFTTGKESETFAAEDGPNKHVAHRDSEGNDIIIDNYGDDGKIHHYEEPIYDSTGNVIGYKYYDKNRKPVASNKNGNKYFDINDKEITEDEFIKLMQAAGIL